MANWRPRKWWSKVSVSRIKGGGHVLLLDDQLARTPDQAVLELPTRALAELIANEWLEQPAIVDPATMPCTRLAATAIDGSQHWRQGIINALAAYVDSDLIFHRAEAPQDLVLRQQCAWDPVLEWSIQEFGIKPLCGIGVMPISQPKTTRGILNCQIASLADLHLSVLHELVVLTGSLLLGFAALRGFDNGEGLWNRSQVDEDWQVEKWGSVNEAEISRLAKRQSFMVALEFLFALEDQQAESVPA